MLTAITIGAFALLFLGVPMWLIFMVLALVALLLQGVAMEVAVQGLMGTINNLVLLAVLGFIFAGGIMARGDSGGARTHSVRWLDKQDYQSGSCWGF